MTLRSNSPLRRTNRFSFVAALMAVLNAGTLSAFADSSEKVDFDRDIRPILSNTCYTCHGPDANKRATELRFDVEESLFGKHDEPVVVRGKPDESALVARITSGDPDYRMPPVDSKQQLSKAQIELLKRWVEQGAPYTGHWSFQPVVRPELPKVEPVDWPRNGIDYFVLNRMAERNLQPSERASKETLIRRITLDLIGLPPTLKEVDAFLADDSQQAFEKVVDRLLASERFGEHFATEWLDAARYADSNGYQQDRTRTLWPWRDWVIRAFNSNMPFDQFSIEQLAGDQLENASMDQQVATGFHRNHMLNGEGGRIAEESRVEYVMNRVETTGAVWLGLTVGCARCHDHKYDPVSQREFYQLYSYFNSIDESGRVDAGGNANPVMPVPTKEQTARRAELWAELADLQKELRSATTAERQLAWEQGKLVELSKVDRPPVWELLKPGRFVSEQGQTMTLQEDGSLLLTGKNPNNDNYDIEFVANSSGITGVRIEAVPHPEFTNGGFARSDSGNFVLTDFSVAARRSKETEFSPVRIGSAQATFEQGSFAIEKSFDGNSKTGWAVHNPSDMKIPRQAVYVFEKPIGGSEGTSLIVRMKHESQYAFHNLSRFRILVTTQPEPKLDNSDGGREALVNALKVESAKRNDAQKKLIAEEFRKGSPEVVAVQKKVDATKKQQSDLDKQIVRTMVMRERKDARETFVLNRGVWDQPIKEQPIQPGTPECLPGLPQDAPKNRLTLANWVVSKNNPLTPRVVVNRYWQHFFGVGLVTTPEDFGSQGERPTHPQLLDWLASEFVDSGWNVKHMLKLIVMSATYRQSSKATPAMMEADSSNQWLARGARFRLTSQAIRDQALMVSGLLVEKLGGPPVKPYQPLGIWSDLSLGKIKYEQDHGENLYRRTLYTFWRRASAPTMLFDVATRQVCKVRTSRTNTPLHALVLMNDDTYVEASRKLAERVMLEGGTSDEDRLAYGFRLATCRHATAAEQSVLLDVLNKVRADYATGAERVNALLSRGESPVNDKLDRSELASFAAVMNMILNLDEVVTKE
ncbi:MAG: PSD1 and planctomycete cytochrome C domain-containing protein [Planctomycetota bacterium]|nr:PSD1 and planctomycete cytochrome C domain-containing protein [Planctomycetota bacterium]